MSQILFPQDTTGVTPATGDIILIADVSDSNNPKDCTLAELPISTATQTALDAKQDTLTGLTASVAELNYTDGVTSAIQTQIDSKAPIASPTFTGTVSGITAAMVGAPSGSGSSSGTNTGDQTITNTSDATSHTATLSATGGSIKLVEGSGITLTTTGTSADGIVTIASTGGGSGDVVGPASATDNAIARFDTTTGKLIQNSTLTLSDLGVIGGNPSFTGQVGFANTTTDSMFVDGGITMEGATYRQINDGGSNELIKFPTTSVPSAVNEFTITNAATGTGPTISATGGDTNIDFNIVTKGSGVVKVNGSAIATGNVTKVGTPVNNQIGVWTGDGTLEGDTALTFDTTTDTLTSGIFNGTALTASQLTATDASKNIVSLAVATYPSLTEISYVKGVTSAIQTQINTKAPSASPTFTGTVVFPSGQALIAPVLGTPTSGTLTNCTGLPLAGVVDSTTEALGVGSLEVGHASDTTLTRVSAGVVAIEGTNIVKAGAVTTSGLTQATNKLLGRGTAATGAIEEITLGTNLSFTGTTLNASGGSLTNFTEAVNTSAPNATVPVVSFTATNGATNVDIAIVPKGTGALTAAIADNLSSGGNKRGNNAIDIQTSRSANTQVASGTTATLVGSLNTASGNNSTAIGYSNTASGSDSSSIGRGNTASGTQSTAAGYVSEASGTQALAVGYKNTASGTGSIALGYESTSQSYGETTLGLWATTGAGTAGSYVSTDRLLVVGNGTATGSRSDAITVLKNGNTTITGTFSNGTSNSTTTGTIELGHATDTTISRVSAGVIAVEGSTVPTLSVANTWTATQTEKAVLYTNDAITASGNAATIPVTHRLHTVTNNSAATLTITLTTAGATDGQMHLIRILDFSAVAQTITWVNTENSTVSAPTTSNGSTTLFLTVGFIYNGATSKWRCISYA